MKQISKYPEEISVVIPAQNYERNVYTDNRNCYLAQALYKIGYTDVSVDGFGLTTLNEIYVYRPIEEFSGLTVQQEFKLGKDIYLTLKRYK